MQQINSSYGNIPDIISTSMAKRGYGSSGNMGNSMYQTQLARLGSQSQFQGQMAGLTSQRQMQAGGLMDQLLQTQVGKNTNTQETTVDPMAAFSALGSLLMMPTGGAGTASLLSKLFSGGSNPGTGQGAFTGSTDDGVWE